MTDRLSLVFAGTPDFAERSLTALIKAGYSLKAVYTQPDRPAGRGQQPQMSPVKVRALEADIPVFQPKTLKDPEAQAGLATLKPDLLIVAAYGLILPQAVLDIPRYGAINVHGSLLPRWRGAAPIQRALLAGDEVTGVTIMQMEAGLDTGPMLYKKTCPITSADTSQTLYQQLASLGAEALLEALALFQVEGWKPEVQPTEGVTYAHKLEKAEGQLLWHLPASYLARQIRAFQPWPGSYFYLGDKTIKVNQATALPDTPSAQPGEIVALSSIGIQIATGEGVLLIEHIQLPNQRAMPVAACLNGHALLFKVGTICQ